MSTNRVAVGTDHYAAAEQQLASAQNTRELLAAEFGKDTPNQQTIRVLIHGLKAALAAAQVHATLATVMPGLMAELPPPPQLKVVSQPWVDDGTCDCDTCKHVRGE